MIRAVLFDLGNTLAPYNDREDLAIAGRLAAWIARRHPIVGPEAFLRLHQEERARDLEATRRTGEENDLAGRIRRVLDRLGVRPEGDGVVAGAVAAVREAFAEVVRIPAATARFVRGLARRYRLAVVSNYLLVEPIHDCLRAAGLADALAAVVVSRGVGRVKPDPAPFRRAVGRLGVDPAEAVHVGDDWRADIIGAWGAGIRPVYTLQFRIWPDPARGTGVPIRVPEIRSLSEVEGILEGFPARDPWRPGAGEPDGGQAGGAGRPNP